MTNQHSKFETPLYITEWLEGIENKIYETGKLVSLTNDNEAECGILFKVIDDDLYLSIEIVSEGCDELDEDDCEDFCDYIRSKIEDLLEEVDDKISKTLSEYSGEKIFLNKEEAFGVKWRKKWEK